ncbi:hypothetical protein ACO2I3_04415 [Leptospira interrogans]
MDTKRIAILGALVVAAVLGYMLFAAEEDVATPPAAPAAQTTTQ